MPAMTEVIQNAVTPRVRDKCHVQLQESATKLCREIVYMPSPPNTPKIPTNSLNSLTDKVPGYYPLTILQFAKAPAF